MLLVLASRWLAIAILLLASWGAGVPRSFAVAQCTKTYTVQSGDWCDRISSANSITTQQLLALNPAINAACTNLQIGQVLCIAPVCAASYIVVSGDTCSRITSLYNMDLAQLLRANPSVNPQCTNLWVGQAICIPPKISIVCSSIYTVRSGDTCDAIARALGLSTAQLMAANPSINAACTNLQIGQQLCVPPSNTCDRWYVVQSGDTCDAIATSQGITVQLLRSLNPDINSGCTNLQVGQRLCIRTGSATPSPSPSPSPRAPSPSPKPSPSPSPRPPSPSPRSPSPSPRSPSPSPSPSRPSPSPSPSPRPPSSNCSGTIIPIPVAASSLFQLAHQLHIDQLQLLALNLQLNASAPLAAGTRVCVPPTNCTYHTVATGEFLYGIARRYNTDVATLVALNPWLQQQGIGLILPQQRLLVAPCAAAPPPPANATADPELVAVATRFAANDSAVQAALSSYTGRPSQQRADAVRLALSGLWGSGRGREVLLQRAARDTQFAAFTRAYESDRSSKCSQFRGGTMPQALWNCVCNSSQPLVYCESLIQKDMDTKFGASLGAAPGQVMNELGRRLQQGLAEFIRTDPSVQLQIEQQKRKLLHSHKARGTSSAATSSRRQSAGTTGYNLAGSSWLAQPAQKRQLLDDVVGVDADVGAFGIGDKNCTNFVKQLFEKGGLQKLLVKTGTKGSFCLDAKCSVPIQVGPLPTTLTVSGGLCVPWIDIVKPTLPNSIQQVRVCMDMDQLGQCNIISKDSVMSGAADAVISSKLFIKVSWCVGDKKLVDTLKYLGIGLCLEVEIAFYPVQGSLQVTAQIKILIVEIGFDLHFQAYDDAKLALGLCDTEERCRKYKFCQTAEGEMMLDFRISVNFWIASKELYRQRLAGSPSGCPALRDRANIAKNPITKIVVYTTDWAQWRRPDNGRPAWCSAYNTTPANIDPSLPTHVNYAFAKVDNRSYAVVDVEHNEPVLIAQLQALKRRNSGLKTLISIGGWSFSRGDEVFRGTGSEKIFPAMAASAANRAAFIRSAINYTKFYGFDGIDIDWEFPNWENQAPAEVGHFTLLMQELRAATRGHNLLLTAAVRSTPNPEVHMDVKAVADAVDFINLMSYDYHGAFDYGGGYRRVNSQTPVLSCDNPLRPGWDINGALEAYLRQGLPANKIVLGLASYGRAFRFGGGPIAPGIGMALDPSAGPPLQGGCTMQPWVLAWYEIKRMGITTNIDERQMAAYGVTPDGRGWVGYDTAETHRRKMCWARSKGISAVMMWDADTDDNNELLRAVKSNAANACSDYQAPRC